MAAGILPKPGSKFGPCAVPCIHKDCAETRASAAAACAYCHKPIGFYVRFYLQDDGLVHASCAEAAAERQEDN